MSDSIPTYLLRDNPIVVTGTGSFCAAGDEGLAPGEQADDAMDFGRFEGLFEGQWRQDGGQALGEHRFAGAGRADEQEAVAAGRTWLTRGASACGPRVDPVRSAYELG